MKRIINNIVFGILVLVAIFAFNACTNNHKEGDGHNHGTEAETTTDEHEEEEEDQSTIAMKVTLIYKSGFDFIFTI